MLERLGRERGFPSETITALLRDRSGFLWVGSREGLAVYDGYGVRIFQHAVSEPRSLSDNAVRKLYEDREGRIWVGLDAGGLQRLDAADRTFDTWRHDPADPHSLGHDAVYAMAEDDAGGLWVGTQDGLDRLDLATGRFERFEADADDPAALPRGWVYDLRAGPDGRIWVATVGGGVARVDPATRRIERVPFAEEPGGATARSALAFSIAEGPDGALWFGVEDGVFRHDAESDTLRRVPMAPLRPGTPTAIVTAIAFDGDGVLWISTWREGLVAHDPSTGLSRSYRHDPARETGLATDRLATVLVDGGGAVWLGTWGEGIQRVHPHAGLFTTILGPGSGDGALPYPEVTSLLEGGDGRLWVGTWGEGLVWRDPGAREFSRGARPEATPSELSTPLALARGGDGSGDGDDGGDGVWMGTMAGLYRIAAAGTVEASFGASASNGSPLGPGYVNALWRGSGGTLWIGSGGSGVYRLDEGDDAPGRRYRHDPQDPGSLSDDHVTSLLVGASDGTLWVGTRSGGLNAIDPEDGVARRFLPRADDPRSLGHHTVTALHEDARGRVWAGTAGGGLARLERGASGGGRGGNGGSGGNDGNGGNGGSGGNDAGGWTVRRVGVEDGLVNPYVVSIEEDDDGTLWIGTRGGLSRYDPGTGRFVNYGAGDGLPGLEFRPGASTAGATHLSFGTLGGVLRIRRGTAFEPAPPEPARIVAIGTLEGPWTGDAPPWRTREIEIPFGTALSLEFGILDLRPPHRFAYRLEEDRPWVDLGTRREVTFAGLRPGTHELSYRGLGSRGTWSVAPGPLTIRVTPPFWMTWWFRGLVVGVLGAAIAASIGARFRWLERRNRELEALHREREAALREARASEEALQEAYGRLRRLTRRLEDAKEDERRRIARELHDEMGQALSAVKINLKALGRQTGESARADRIEDALALVDEIIGQVRALSLDLRPPLLEELGLVAALRGYAEGQSMRSGVPIAVEANGRADDLRAELAFAAFRLVQESIHNVLRHADARGITVSVRRDPERLRLSVRDDGRGFDVPAALARAAEGGHLGLLGMRERVEALGGTFEIESSAGQGTAIHATIPVELPTLEPPAATRPEVPR